MESHNDKRKIRTYLGPRGYTVYREDLTPERLEKITQDLTFAPFAIEGYGVPPEPFCVMGKSKNKLFLPKFYGYEEFGPPQKNKLPKPENIKLVFNGELRASQRKPVETALSAARVEKGGGIVCLPCGYGKCLGKDTPVMMHDGSVKMVQDVKVGDFLMGDDSTPRTVLSTCQGQEQLYQVIPKKGDPYVVNESHILSLKYSANPSKKWMKKTIVDIEVNDYLNLPKSYHGCTSPLLGYRVPVNFPEKKVGFDPYIIGLWLGNESSKGTKITTQDATVIQYLEQKLSKYDYRMCSVSAKNPLLDELRNQDLIMNKHIPMDYKCNSRDVRLKVLAGLIDSDGFLHDDGSYDIMQKNEQLLDDIIFLARSLGFAAYKKKCQKREGTYFCTNIHGKGISDIPVLIAKKKAPKREQIKDVLTTCIHLEKLDVGDYYGFEIDGNRRFLLGDFTVTHNTCIGLYLVAELGVKTLIVCHKEFLVEQWRERIQMFLPKAKIGIIQQKRAEVGGKDIVIAMLQSLSMKDYPSEIFSSFGMVIYDEVHCVPCKVFSKALRKTQTRYQFGLSATPTRSDGMHKVTKLYLGPIIFRLDRRHTAKNPKGMQVIRVYPRKVPNNNFYKGRMNYKGKPDIARMLTKLVLCPSRRDIVAALLTYFAVKDDRHILVLSDRIQYLKDIEARIEVEMKSLRREKKSLKVGYYIGGMKQADRKKSETCSIILATYSMAKEAMDIPILDTLLMATPKSNIEQAVGRILRKEEYPDERPPLVIDYVDHFSCFGNQAGRRNEFYVRNQYPIQDLVFDLDNLSTFEPELKHCLDKFSTCVYPDSEVIEVEPIVLSNKPVPKGMSQKEADNAIAELGDALFL